MDVHLTSGSDEPDRYTLRKEEVHKKIAAGLESLRRGEGTDGEAFFDGLEAELDLLEAQR